MLSSPCFERARLHRLRKKSRWKGFVSGHDFSRAVKPFTFVIPSGLEPARNLLFPVLPHPLQPCRKPGAPEPAPSLSKGSPGCPVLAWVWLGRGSSPLFQSPQRIPYRAQQARADNQPGRVHARKSKQQHSTEDGQCDGGPIHE